MSTVDSDHVSGRFHAHSRFLNTTHCLLSTQTMSINPVPSIIRVADAELFAKHIFPLVLLPKDKRNCMLVCKQWYSQMRMPSAWRHVRTIKVCNNYEGLEPVLFIRGDASDEVWLNIMTQPNERGVVPDQHALSLLQLCTNIRTVEWQLCQLLCCGVDKLIGLLDDGKLQWPTLSIVRCGLMNSDDLEQNLAKCDHLLSTTFNRVQRVGLAFTLLHQRQQQQQQQLEKTFLTLMTLISHNVHKLHELGLYSCNESTHRLCTALLSSVLHEQPAALSVLSVWVNNAEDRQMLIDLINLQRDGTLTQLYIRDWDANTDWCTALLNSIDRCAALNLQTFRCDAKQGIKLANVCALLAEKCKNASTIKLEVCASEPLTLAEFATIAHRFTSARKNFTLECPLYLPAIDDQQQRQDYKDLQPDQLAAALRDQFDAQQFDGNVEKEIFGTDFRFRVNDCEFVFKTWPLMEI